MALGWKSNLLKDAETALAHSYAPHSGLRIGAAVLLDTEEIYLGCNVENDSYGLTICAERAAIFAAVAAKGKAVTRGADKDKSIKVVAIAIAASKAGTIPYPCGACRQVIAQFGSDALVIYRERGSVRSKSMKLMLPYKFVL